MSKLRCIMFSAAFILLLVAGQRGAIAQGWEAGLGGGASFYTEQSVSNPSGEAKAGLDMGYTVSGWIGHNLYEYMGGEIHYSFQQNDLRLSSSGSKATFGGRSHAVHYDFLYHTSPVDSKVRPFFAVGGGYKRYSGTGTEAPTQVLQEFAILSKTSEWKPMLTFAGGVKVKFESGLSLRLEFRDYLTQFPTKVIAPVPGADVGGWLHNFVPSIGISFTF